ncbi:MAG: tetratricopeptide repeat protein [Bacteroidia bacterium]|nr:tetratricopeptide repeat protein [Bacteroidia bacterium]
MKGRAPIQSIIVFATCFGFLLAIFCCSPSDKKVVAAEVSPYLNLGDSAHYLGINACRNCHLDKYATFLETGMGSSFDVASRLKSSAQFEGIKPVYDSFKNLYYFPFWKNDKMFISEYRLKGKDTVYKRTEQISYIIGSGHHTNSHMTAENGYVFQAPLTFYTQLGKWDLPPGFENGNNSRFGRRIGLECMSCHNALPQEVEGSDNRYSDIPHGISCERCHGPGSIHVAQKEKGIVVDTKAGPDYTIVNPSRLPWKRQIDVCQRCHLQGDIVLKPGKSFHDFKPGMELSSVFDVFSPSFEDGGENFVMAAHAERFQQSECFIKSNKGAINNDNPKLIFTCISCHNPHVSVRKTNVLNFNTVCKNCHTEPKQTCTEKVAIQAKAEFNCVSCHMPQRGAADIPHVSVHDHYIRKPGKSEDVKKSSGNPTGLVCITNDKPDVRTLLEAYTSYYEKFEHNKMYLQKAEELIQKLDLKNNDHVIALIHFYYTKNDYSEIVKASKNYKHINDGWTAYRISRAFDNLNKIDQSEFWIEKACESEKENIEFLLQRGITAIELNKVLKAREQFNDINKRYSKNARSWAYLGYTYALEKNPSKAKEYYLKALSLDPDLMLALTNLADLYKASGDKIHLKEIIERILVIEPGNTAVAGIWD